MNGNFYITTTIPYVNAHPHVGFALELAQADAIARYHRLCGKEVRFQTGTDENAFKNVTAAREHGLETKTFVDANARRFRELSEALGVSHDEFVRTTEKRHALAVSRLWTSLRPSDVFRRRYDGLYCAGCEDFLFARDLVEGRCPDHDVSPRPVVEENWFFRLSAYQIQLDALIAEGRLRIVPDSRRNEVLAFIRRGLDDISISRNAERAGGWGIAVPGDPTQVIYVWIDALANYLTGLGYGQSSEWLRFWGAGTRKVHILGKNVWKFHAIYWPALLLSAGLRCLMNSLSMGS
jgi:methionyl-tRNA synthetase